jgi:C terminal of Calcineurin-like phosphoesterase/N terminal of Calcineurin-like phosphoesterase/Calcineurin-like phosphoesterase
MTLDAVETSRRSVVTGGLAVAALALSASSVDQPMLVSGTVFDDHNASGVHSAGIPGIAGVMVSNGVDVTISDQRGRWQLPVRVGEHVFVVKPSDWSAPRGPNGLPALWQRIEASTALGDVDFGLRRIPEPRRFEVALLADTQPQSMLELGYLRDSVLSSVIDSRTAFAINHGDIVFDRPDLHDRYLNLIAGTGIPWHHCPGNHDMNAGDSANCFETWKRTFGPCHYAFQYGGATFILLNNVEPLPDGAHTKGGYNYRGRIGRNQLLFVERILQNVPRDQLVVVSMHIPLVGWEDPDEPSSNTADCKALMALLSGRPNTLSLAGHMHTTEHHYLGRSNGFTGPGTHHHHVLTAACGSWWSGPFDTVGQPLALSRDGTPKGFHILEVEAEIYRTRFVPVGAVNHSQVRLALEAADTTCRDDPERRIRLSGSILASECDGASISVNVFDGGPRTKVTCEIVGTAKGALPQSQGLTLTREALFDVAVAETYTQHRAVVKPWIQASVSSHLWRSKLPVLQAGTYVAAINVVDEYSRVHHASLMFEVVA